jgi:hypothetical protein
VGVGVEEGWHAGTRTLQLPDAEQLSWSMLGGGEVPSNRPSLPINKKRKEHR